MTNRFVVEWIHPQGEENQVSLRTKGTYEEAVEYAKQYGSDWKYVIHRLQPVTKKTGHLIEKTSTYEPRFYTVEKESLEACMEYMQRKFDLAIKLETVNAVICEDNLKKMTLNWKDGNKDTYTVVEKEVMIDD